MTLRSVLVALFGGAAALAALGTWFEPGLFGLTVMLVIFTAALALERRRYGAASAQRPGPGWVRTEERFFDDKSGELVDVWFDPASGERHYLKAQQP